MSQLNVVLVPQLQDNYAFLLICQETKQAAIIDCPDANPMIERIEQHGVKPFAILNTHHHWDHIGGNDDLIARYPGIQLYGSKRDEERIPGLTHLLEEGDTVQIGNSTAQVLLTPGHTRGHIAYWFAQDYALFCGDTLFVGGCGRVFEGTPQQMHDSIQKLGALSPQARLYCGHEYTASNLRFALSIDPDNKDLQAKQNEVTKKRENGEPTVPSTLAEEWKYNPFLRTNSPIIQRVAQAQGADPTNGAAVFAAIRGLKDHF